MIRTDPKSGQGFFLLFNFKLIPNKKSRNIFFSEYNKKNYSLQEYSKIWIKIFQIIIFARV